MKALMENFTRDYGLWLGVIKRLSFPVDFKSVPREQKIQMLYEPLQAIYTNPESLELAAKTVICVQEFLLSLPSTTGKSPPDTIHGQPYETAIESWRADNDLTFLSMPILLDMVAAARKLESEAKDNPA